MFKNRIILFAFPAALAAVILAGCKKNPAPPAQPQPPAAAQAAVPAAAEKPVAPEINPPGDIPDSQVFVKYSSAEGKYSLDVPEGWARSEHGADVSFADKFDGVAVVLSKSPQPPTEAGIRTGQAAALKKDGRAVEIQGIKTKKMHGAAVICVTYASNSAPDPVTGKQLRLENAAYYYYNNGGLAALTMWAPSGADNVDQWKRMSESFRWR